MAKGFLRCNMAQTWAVPTHRGVTQQCEEDGTSLIKQWAGLAR